MLRRRHSSLEQGQVRCDACVTDDTLEWLLRTQVQMHSDFMHAGLRVLLKCPCAHPTNLTHFQSCPPGVAAQATQAHGTSRIVLLVIREPPSQIRAHHTTQCPFCTRLAPTFLQPYHRAVDVPFATQVQMP